MVFQAGTVSSRAQRSVAFETVQHMLLLHRDHLAGQHMEEGLPDTDFPYPLWGT